MNKKDAIIKARQGMTAGDLRAILNEASPHVTSEPSKLNSQLTKWQVWNMFHGAINCEGENDIVDVMIATNILREFAPDEPKEAKVLNPNGIPF